MLDAGRSWPRRRQPRSCRVGSVHASGTHGIIEASGARRCVRTDSEIWLGEHMSQSKSDRLREIKDNDTRTRKLAVNIGYHRSEPSKVKGHIQEG